MQAVDYSTVEWYFQLCIFWRESLLTSEGEQRETVLSLTVLPVLQDLDSQPLLETPFSAAAILLKFLSLSQLHDVLVSVLLLPIPPPGGRKGRNTALLPMLSRPYSLHWADALKWSLMEASTKSWICEDLKKDLLKDLSVIETHICKGDLG